MLSLLMFQMLNSATMMKKSSFDAIIGKYNLEDRALQELAKIVRGEDTDQSDPPPESIGLEAIAEGFRQITMTDFDNATAKSKTDSIPPLLSLVIRYGLTSGRSSSR